jgi:hypothetical protein
MAYHPQHTKRLSNVAVGEFPLGHGQSEFPMLGEQQRDLFESLKMTFDHE